MLAFSNDYYGIIFRATQSVELFCAYEIEQLKRTIQIEEALKKQQETESAATMEEKDATIQAQNEELQKYRDKDLKKENRKKFIKKVGVF